MRKFIQLLAAFSVTLWVAPYLFATPFYHWMVFVPIFAGSMYAVALVQHWYHWRFSRRGMLGSRPNGTPFMPRRGTSD